MTGLIYINNIYHNLNKCLLTKQVNPSFQHRPPSYSSSLCCDFDSLDSAAGFFASCDIKQTICTANTVNYRSHSTIWNFLYQHTFFRVIITFTQFPLVFYLMSILSSISFLFYWFWVLWQGFYEYFKMQFSLRGFWNSFVPIYISLWALNSL